MLLRGDTLQNLYKHYNVDQEELCSVCVGGVLDLEVTPDIPSCVAYTVFSDCMLEADVN